MGVSVAAITDDCAQLRRAQSHTLKSLSQADVVAALDEWACRWREPFCEWRKEAETLTEPFPWAMTRISLEALLQSLTPNALWDLIDAENVRDKIGYPLLGHVIAGNTPLLAWTSLLRALLMRSASYVKLPSNAASQWAHLFHRSLAQVSPALASSIHLQTWPGGTSAFDAALCANVDCVIAYGSNDTINALRAQCPSTTDFLGYDHRVSFGLCSALSATPDTARGFARDLLLYDQGGCLSPHVLYVKGEWTETLAFAEQLAQALPEAALLYPQNSRSPTAARKVREARLLARMASETRVWEDTALRWTVIARPTSLFTISPSHGVVSVQPLTAWDELPMALAPVLGHLQGCAPAADVESEQIETRLEELGVSRICAPGNLQAPPFAWRQDGKDLLRSLRPNGP